MYEVHALKYSERDTTKCHFFYREAAHDMLTLHDFVWLILGGPEPVLDVALGDAPDRDPRGSTQPVRASSWARR
jgi:hypothetical protein